MRIHELKTWPEPFEAVYSGRKNFELRTNDRAFAVGDRLRLREYNPDNKQFTGREINREISYILEGGDWGLPSNLCVLSWGTTSKLPTLTEWEGIHERHCA